MYRNISLKLRRRMSKVHLYITLSCFLCISRDSSLIYVYVSFITSSVTCLFRISRAKAKRARFLLTFSASNVTDQDRFFFYSLDQPCGAGKSLKIGNVEATVSLSPHRACSLGGFDTKYLPTNYRFSFVLWRSLVYFAPSHATRAITLYFPCAPIEISTDTWVPDH